MERLGDFLFKHIEGSPRTIKGVLRRDPQPLYSNR
jgi:hypothetical protein